MPPSCVTDEAIVEKYSSEYMYLEAIKFINIVRLESRDHSVDKNGILRSAQPITVQPHQDAVVEEDQHSSSTLLGSRSTGKVPCDATPAIRYHFPMTWTPEVDPSRQQLKYVNGPHRNDEENPNATYSCCSHMAVGNQKEFTEIQVVPCRCFA